jgi:thiamine-phosphate pyrophosphorylase
MVSRPEKAEPRPAPRLYLMTPAITDAQAFAAPLGHALAAGDVAAVLVRLADSDERTLINRVKTLCSVVQDNDAALLVDRHVDLVARSGADGVHVTGLTDFSNAIERLKPERIVGAGGLVTRHDAMTVAEAGADYVMFGEPGARGERPSLDAIEERVGWWAEVFEIPCVAYAAAVAEVAPLASAGADFVALGEWLWGDSRVASVVERAMAGLRQPERAA